MRKWGFFKWTRDNQKRFADEVAAELDNKASKDTVDNLVAGSVSKAGATMTDTLVINMPARQKNVDYPIKFTTRFNEESHANNWGIGASTITGILYFTHNNTKLVAISETLGLFPDKKGLALGHLKWPWKNTYTQKINNGEDIEIPAKAGTMALVSDIEDILRQHGLIPPETTEQTEQQGVENA